MPSEGATLILSFYAIGEIFINMTKNNAITELINDFSYFDGWEDKYAYLIELGDKLPDFPEKYMTEEYFVPGCVSKVWMVPSFDGDTFNFIASSNGDITKGMIYILYLAYNGQDKADIADINIEGIFDDLGLSKNITPQRRNGFYAMVQKIKSFAA